MLHMNVVAGMRTSLLLLLLIQDRIVTDLLPLLK